MNERTPHASRRLIALGVVAIVLAACGSNSSPAASPSAVSSPSASAGAFDLGSIEASVAYIQTQGTFVTADGTAEQIYSGSGFVVDPSGLIVTNNHVVNGGAFWKVSIGADKTLLDAQLVGVSECSDLAVLKVSGGGTYPALTMASASPSVGTQIYVAGHPNGDPYTLTNGIVAKPAAPDETSWASVQSEIQITAQTYPGNSGSPVVNAAGQVVGIQYASGVPGSAIAGESFAIASSEAKNIIDQIKTSGNLDYIGLNGEVKADKSGIAIIAVAPGSPADKAGIQAGDLLTNLNGTAVGTDGTKATYCSVLRSHKPDATLTVAVSRAGQMLSGEINGRPLSPASGAPTPTLTPASQAPASGSPSGDTGIDKLSPFVPSSIWTSCKHSTVTSYPTILQTAICSYTGVDAVWYDLYGSAADLSAAYKADVANFNAQPSSTTLTCATGNVDSTWNWTGATADPNKGLLCYKDSKGHAWIEQADPTVGVMFTALLSNGNQKTLDDWWLKNDTIIEPGS